MEIVDLFATQIQIFSLGKISYRMLSQREVLSQFIEMFSLTMSLVVVSVVKKAIRRE